MLGAQIAMAVDDTAMAHPQRRSRRHGGRGSRRCARSMPRMSPAGRLKRGIEQHALVEGEAGGKVGKMHRGRQKGRRGSAIKVRQHGGELVELWYAQAPVGDTGIEHVALVETPHRDQPVDRLAVAADREPPVQPRQRLHTEIDIRREAPVEPDLGAAGGFAARQRGEIEIRKAHRLLQLVDVGTGEEHPRHVGLAHLDRRRARIGARVFQERHLGAQRWRAVCSLSVQGAAPSPTLLNNAPGPASVDTCQTTAHRRRP